MKIEEINYAIDVIKNECYVFNPLNFDRSTMINQALDIAIRVLNHEKNRLEIDNKGEKIC